MEVIEACPDWRDEEGVVHIEKKKEREEIERKWILARPQWGADLFLA